MLCLELLSDGQINRNISGAHTNVHIPSFWARELAAINSLGPAIETDLISMCSRLFTSQCIDSERAETPFLYCCSLKDHVWVKYQDLWESFPPPTSNSTKTIIFPVRGELPPPSLFLFWKLPMMDLFHFPEVCFHAQYLTGQGLKQEHRPDVPFHTKNMLFQCYPLYYALIFYTWYWG